MPDELDFLDIYDTRTLSEAGEWVTLQQPGQLSPAVHRDTGEVLRFKVLGPDSPRRQRVLDDFDRAVGSASLASPDQRVDPEILWNLQHEYFSKLVVDWSGFGVGFTTERVRRAFDKQRAWFGQVFNFSQSRSGFLLKPEPPGSPPAGEGSSEASGSPSGRRTERRSEKTS
jgi:hypothetical protein